MTAPAPTALDTQDLRSRLRRRLTRTTIAASAAALLAVVSAIVLSTVDAHLSAEQATFDHYDGEILSIHADGGDSSTGSAKVTFVQSSHRRTADVDLDNTASFSPGPATVLVDPHDPGFVTLPGENYFPDGSALALLFIGGFGTCALLFGAAAWSTHRNYSVLANSNWQTVSGFVTSASRDKNNARWVLFLPDDAGSSFWVFAKRLPTPQFTGSVAIDGRDRLVLRVDDGKHLAFASRDASAPTWTRHRVASVTLREHRIEFRYFERDEGRRCSIDCDALTDATDATAAALTGASSINVLAGPLQTAVVHVPSIGVIGIGVVEKDRARRWWERSQRTLPTPA